MADPESRAAGRRAPSPGRGATLYTGTGPILWLTVPVRLKTEKAGSHKLYLNARKVRWALQAA